MKRLLLALCLSLVAKFGFAITPYSLGSKLAAADLATQLTAVETKLKEAGFTVVGRHTPKVWPRVPAWWLPMRPCSKPCAGWVAHPSPQLVFG